MSKTDRAKALAPAGIAGRPALGRQGATGPRAETRRFNRSFAVIARELGAEYVMLDYLMAIMEGHGQATIKLDEETGERYVDRPDKGMSSTPEQRQWAWTQWRQAAHGMPAQNVHLEADVRAQMASVHADVDLNALPPLQAAALHHAIMRALAPPPAGALPASTDHAAMPAVIDVPVASSSSSHAPGDRPVPGAESDTADVKELGAV